MMIYVMNLVILLILLFPILKIQDANYLIKQSRIRNMLKKAVILCTVAILVCCLWRGILIYKSYRDSENSKVNI